MSLWALPLGLMQVVSSLALRTSNTTTDASGIAAVPVDVVESALTLLRLSLPLTLTSLVGLLALDTRTAALHALSNTHTSPYAVIGILGRVRLVGGLG